MNRYVKWLLLIAAVAPLLCMLLLYIFLPGVILDQAQRLGKKIGYQISIGAIDVNPLLLRLRLHDLSLASQSDKGVDQGEPLLKIDQLDVDARFWPLLVGQLSIEKIELASPEILLSRRSDTELGTKTLWNWQKFFTAFGQLNSVEHTEKKAQESSLSIVVDEVVVNAGRLAIRDGTAGKAQLAYDFGPFSLQLTDLSHQTAPEPGETNLSSKYALKLGHVVMPLPKVDGVPDRQLAFDQITATGYLIENSVADLKVGLDLALDDGQIQSIWQLSSHGVSQGDIHLVHLAVKPWLALAPSYEPLDSPTGTINGQVTLKQDSLALTLDADMTLDALDIRVQGSMEPLLAWASTTLSKLHLMLPRAENKSAVLTINDVLIDQPRIRLVMDAQSQSNFHRLFSKPEPKSKPLVATEGGTTDTVVPSSKIPAKASPSSSVFRYDVRSIRLKNGAMHFADEAIKPVFRVGVTDLNGSVQGISNAPNRYASLVLSGRAAKTGSFRARGQLAFADPRQNNDVSLIFRNIPLNATNPYAMTFAGYAIDDGRIDVDLRYVTKDGALQGQNHFVIRKIKLGEPVAEYEGTRLPLGLAIALLEDSDGMIDVNIPVKGNVNEPEFSVGHLVWQAVKTLLTNVVTAPFRALGALLGLENMDAMTFVSGESALPPEAEEGLTKIAEYLAKRPKSQLVILGTYDPSVDAVALARAMADTAILEASGIRVVAGEPLPLPNLSDPQVKAGLKTAYGAQLGRIKLGQRLLTLPDNAERGNQLRQELIESYKITDEQLKQLATRRAATVQARLLTVDSNLAARISTGEPEPVSADEAGVPIRVTIKTLD